MFACLWCAPWENPTVLPREDKEHRGEREHGTSRTWGSAVLHAMWHSVLLGQGGCRLEEGNENRKRYHYSAGHQLLFQVPVPLAPPVGLLRCVSHPTAFNTNPPLLALPSATSCRLGLPCPVITIYSSLLSIVPRGQTPETN